MGRWSRNFLGYTIIILVLLFLYMAMSLTSRYLMAMSDELKTRNAYSVDASHMGAKKH